MAKMAYLWQIQPQSWLIFGKYKYKAGFVFGKNKAEEGYQKKKIIEFLSIIATGGGTPFKYGFLKIFQLFSVISDTQLFQR